jgi:hypothetical protein
VLEALRRGELVIDRLTTRQSGKEIDIPDGMVHHWIGVVFVPGATVDKALSLLQDYDHHAQIYAPAVAASKLLSRDGNDFRVYLRFMMKKVITVVVNSEHDARFTREAPNRASSRIYSTRVAEVESPGRLGARKAGRQRSAAICGGSTRTGACSNGMAAHTCNANRYRSRRDIPLGFAWLIRPFVTSIPRESLEFTLTTTRKCASQITKRRPPRRGSPDPALFPRCGLHAT